METAYRKIELDSPLDLQYVIANASQAARQKIDLHFPTAAHDNGAQSTAHDSIPSEDPMRRRVEELVQAFIEETFHGVKQNMTVNGHDGPEMEQLLRDAGADGAEMESFDARLAARMQDVSASIEALQLKLADMRRTAPARTAARFVAGHDRSEAQRRKELEEREARAVASVGEGVVLDTGGLKEVRDMRRSWEEGTASLVKIGREIGATMGRVEQAREGVVYLENA